MNYYLLEIDNYIKNIERKELIYIYIMIFGGIFFLSYYFLFEISAKELETAITEKKKLSRNLRDYKDYLSFHDEYEVGQIQNQIVELRDEIELLRDKKDFINQKINSLSNVIYNRESWTNFLKSISNVANSSGVEIVYIKNHFLEANSPHQSFNSFLQVEIQMTSNYLNSLDFIGKIESSSLVVSIDSLKMSLTDYGVTSTISISIWGIKI